MIRPLPVLPDGPQRPIIVHYHIFKNAGSTIDAVLNREFGDRFAEVSANGDTAVIDAQGLCSFMRRNHRLAAISSHHFRYPLPRQANLAVFDFCLIRHPLDRLYSMHSYFRKPGVGGPLHDLGARLDLPEFLEHMLREHPVMIRNAQVNLLACAGHSGEIGETESMRAAGMLKEIMLIGTVDLFDESLVLAEYVLRPYFPAVEFHYTPQNVTNSREEPLRNRLARMHRLCGHRLFRSLKRANEFDIHLWRAARTEVLRRLRRCENSRELCADFRSRCRQLQERRSLRERVRRWFGLSVPARPAISQSAFADP